MSTSQLIICGKNIIELFFYKYITNKYVSVKRDRIMVQCDPDRQKKKLVPLYYSTLFFIGPTQG